MTHPASTPAIRPLLAAVLCTVLAWPPAARAAWPKDGLPITASGRNYLPTVIPDGLGGAIVAWHGDAGVDIFAQHVTAQGGIAAGWPTSQALTVCAAGGLQEYPALASDSAGGAYVVWQDARSGTHYDIFAQLVTCDGQVPLEWPAGGRVVCSSPGNQMGPVVTADGSGGALIAWYDARNGSGNYDIYAHHVNASCELVPGWPVTGLPVCTAANHQVNPAIAPDGAGGAFIAWQDARAGAEYDIYLQRVTASGQVAGGWPAGGIAVCAAPHTQISPVAVSDGSGGVLLVWQDYRSGTDNDIYAQHVTASGALAAGWPQDGQSVCAARNSQYYPSIDADRTGGVFVAWQDYRSGVDNDIYAQRLTGAGAVAAGWPADGLRVSGAANGQYYPRVAADGAGGADLAWYDNRAGATNDIYVHQVSSDGRLNPLWPADGLAACAAPNSQSYPVLVSTGSGLMIVSWQDQRAGVDGVSAIYAGESDGRTTAVGGHLGAASRVGYALPNPFRGELRLPFALARPEVVRADVFDVLGRRVRTLADRSYPAGTHVIRWDGALPTGQSAPPGVYLVRTRWSDFENTQRVVRLR